MTSAWAKRGSTNEERLRLHVVVAPSGCWVWTATLSEAGYGRIRVAGKTLYAHRLSYETFVGPLLAGMQIDHLCRYPRCVNPRHLQQVTPSTNVQRGTSPGARALRRTHCANGHDFAEHGVVRIGRRICRTCRVDYSREYSRKRRAAELDRLCRASA